MMRYLLLLLLLGLVVGLTQAQAQDITTGLVGRWKFDEGTGTTAVNSGGTGDGTLTNGASYVTGKIGPWAVSVTGASSQYVTFGDYAAADFGTGNFTVAFWAQGPFPINTCLVAKDNESGDGNGLYLWVDENNVFAYWNGTASSSCLTDMSPSTWQHLAIVRTGTGANQVMCYGNGSAGPTATDSRTLTNALEFRLGSCTTTAFTSGSFDDLRLYNRALTAGDITALVAFTEPAAPSTRPRIIMME